MFLFLALLPFLPACLASLTVTLPYATYTGKSHVTYPQLTTWLGIRYAAPPLGPLRWRPPQPPAQTNSTTIADTYGPACPQTMPNIPGLPFVPGDENCLFLNVYAPSNATNLPVVVWIHGGGYGLGDGRVDMGPFLTKNSGIVGVAIQYRLGPFGFLASNSVKNDGVVNAGLLDQKFALEWVAQYIHLFGGDPKRVTVMGESAGAGSVLLHAMAEEAAGLFESVIAASPWVPTQPVWNDTTSEGRFAAFVGLAGCGNDKDKMACLRGKESRALQVAGNTVQTRTHVPHGNWAFIPVTDGDYVLGPPSTHLLPGKVNGRNLLVGNNANEGSLIPPANISTQAHLVSWMQSYLFSLSPANITTLLNAYPASAGPNARYETSGRGPGTAVTVSQVAAGDQQRCYNMYAESSVICPAYWFADAYATPNHSAFYYQYSVPFAVHGADLSAYWGPPTENQGADLVTAFQRIYGNFIKAGNPSLSREDANGRSGGGENAASRWPVWKVEEPVLVNLNQTGGRAYTTLSSVGVSVTQFRGDGLRNQFEAAGADEWEGGRGKRCEVWRGLGRFVPM
ncbi:hypothetical protein OQA88_7507 [Cercophora sp. LCS_1]